MRKILLTSIFVSIAGVLSAQEDSLRIDQYSVEELSDSLDGDFGLELEETVVVGYGTQKRGDLTSAVSSVKAEDIMKQPATTAMQSLQGKLSGVNVLNSDAPGATPTVIIRGMGTALNGMNPLYIVDGLVVSNINNINPNDIQSIDVLKDAASSAIYGVRGANGVVIVTTKRGRGKTRITYDAYAGVRNAMNMVDMAGTQEYVQYFNEAEAAAGGIEFLSTSQPYNTDWFDEVLNTGMFFNNSVAISGSSDNFGYYFGVDHFAEEGILDDNKFKRTTVRNNNDYKLFDNRLRISQNISATFTHEIPKPFGAIDLAYRQSPLMPVTFADGTWGVPNYNVETGVAGPIGQPMNSHGNPVANLYFNNEKINTTTLQGNLEATLDIVDGLSVTSRAGATKYWYNKRAFAPLLDQWLAADPTRTEAQYTGNKNSLTFNEIETFRWSWENFVTYTKSFGSHNLSAVVGVNAEEQSIGFFSNMTGYNVPVEEQYWSIHHATGETTIDQNNYTKKSLASYFGRLQYDFDKRYFITAIIRRDGSSTFYDNKDFWGTFPSISAAWNVTNEEFLKDNGVINFLKLRGGWGKLGNDNIPFIVNKINTSLESNSANYVFGPGQDLIFGAYLGSPVKDVSWEIVKEYGGGVDFEFLSGKLFGTADYYHKTTENAILKITPVYSSGFNEDFYDHAAEIVNKGYEFSLGWRDNTSSGLRYSVSGNINFNDNEIVSVLPAYEGMMGGSLGNGRLTKRLEAGQELGSWWMYEVEGIWQSDEEITNNPHIAGAQPGFLRYKDQNGDGVIDDRDKKFFGGYIPSYTYGVNLSLEYKGFDFSVTGYGVGGNKIYNGINNARIGGENVSMEMYNDRWTGAGTSNTNPGAYRDYEASNYYLEDGDYFRLSNVTLGYNFRDMFGAARNMRVYVTAQNLFMITKYSGFTPELTRNTGDQPYDGNPYGTTGVELSAYPTIRTFLAGVNFEF
ncbi:SusC/RagA family TonB-linked outer membrane protein [Moheibacter sediminis]|uniref:TonB-linked outer membrane protein, SusC/RagA family n=1 Tax=Moheibacter sediminis TaxID=1434700 RepID=A0A1W2C224_9FLAO|nr:SusC/RagA family TonB-linked outer membrane protein [Moheibacter sediminis]SMC79200.1 TonB-linked outer membrane protein, SusC/RagA family [Moheibacter sediminis]